jgi:hypothetical protein
MCVCHLYIKGVQEHRFPKKGSVGKMQEPRPNIIFRQFLSNIGAQFPRQCGLPACDWKIPTVGLHPRGHEILHEGWFP